mmetsp:Transcript_2095/g.6208  ORF Transcript_2095/g.6208 Transcript_2095/m.6208 type:complete len:220 (-) Transcript_2095:1495-2154(-)
MDCTFDASQSSFLVGLRLAVLKNRRCAPSMSVTANGGACLRGDTAGELAASAPLAMLSAPGLVGIDTESIDSAASLKAALLVATLDKEGDAATAGVSAPAAGPDASSRPSGLGGHSAKCGEMASRAPLSTSPAVMSTDRLASASAPSVEAALRPNPACSSRPAKGDPPLDRVTIDPSPSAEPAELWDASADTSWAASQSAAPAAAAPWSARKAASRRRR